MKKIHLLTFVIIISMIFQSCSITSESTFHKDETSSMLMSINMKQAMEMIKGLGDSSKSKMPLDVSQYPKTWQSLYDVGKKKALEKGEKYQIADDTAKVMKKIFTKMDLDENKELQGVSLKFDHLKNSEIKMLSKIDSKESKPLSSTDFTIWDGKKLVLDLSKINSETLMNSTKKPDEGGIKTDEKQDSENMKNITKMFKIDYKSTIKFDQKIKKIEGKNDWLKKIDDYTILLTVDFSQLLDEDTKMKNQDSKIMITTE